MCPFLQFPQMRSWYFKQMSLVSWRKLAKRRMRSYVRWQTRAPVTPKWLVPSTVLVLGRTHSFILLDVVRGAIPLLPLLGFVVWVFCCFWWLCVFSCHITIATVFSSRQSIGTATMLHCSVDLIRSWNLLCITLQWVSRTQ